MAQIWVDWVDCNPGLRHICSNNIILGPFIDYSRRISGILVGSATKMINEVAEVGPNKAASANVETVFSGAGKFSKDAEKSSAAVTVHYPADLLRRVVCQAALRMEVFILARPRGRDRESLQCQVSPCASLHAAPTGRGCRVLDGRASRLGPRPSSCERGARGRRRRGRSRSSIIMLRSQT